MRSYWWSFILGFFGKQLGQWFGCHFELQLFSPWFQLESSISTFCIFMFFIGRNVYFICGAVTKNLYDFTVLIKIHNLQKNVHCQGIVNWRTLEESRIKQVLLIMCTLLYFQCVKLMLVHSWSIYCSVSVHVRKCVLIGSYLAGSCKSK